MSIVYLNHLLHPNNDMFPVLYTKIIDVYNFQVEDVEHYIANGFVVHNCSDCDNLNGRVYRASVWQASGLYPQSHSLACKGFRCKCKMEITNDRITPGKVPGLSGKRKKRR